jgi:uncharacterized protein (DUF1810 family)
MQKHASPKRLIHVLRNPMPGVTCLFGQDRRREAMDDPYNLQRFVDAQQLVFAGVIEELKYGSKRGHWMWFIFPQLKGLGRTAQSTFFGISSIHEAAAYLQHPVLGPRLKQCAQLVNAVERRSAEDIFGEIDAMKFRSSMTLFASATPENQIFTDALKKYYAGEFDPLTIDYLRKQNSI